MEYSLDDYEDNVQCHINNVTLIDVWENTEEELRDPKLEERFSPEQLEEGSSPLLMMRLKPRLLHN